MPLVNFFIRNFRNLKLLDGRLASGLNVIEGENAQGKTNILEAIYFLANGRSFRTPELASLIAFGESAAEGRAELQNEDLTHRLEFRLDPEGRQTWLQEKRLGSLQKLHELMRVLVFTPDSSTLMRGTPGQRRRYFDQAIGHHSPSYGPQLLRYGRILRQRNLCLESSASPAVLAGFNEQWAESALLLREERERYLQKLLPRWRRRWTEISGMRGMLTASWESGLAWTSELAPKDWMEKLEEQSALERRVKRTLLGPHRDDLAVTLDQHPVRETASQGQQRLLVIALKLAEADLFQEKTGRAPIFLLDDLGSELDSVRQDRLLGMLGEIHSQTLLTTAQKGSYSRLHAQTFWVQEGQWSAS